MTALELANHIQEGCGEKGAALVPTEHTEIRSAKQLQLRHFLRSHRKIPLVCRNILYRSQDTDDQGAYFFSLAGAAMNPNFGDSPTLVRHSTAGEVERCIGRHGASWVAGAVLGAAVPPVMLKSATNPEGFGRIVGT